MKEKSGKSLDGGEKGMRRIITYIPHFGEGDFLIFIY